MNGHVNSANSGRSVEELACSGGRIVSWIIYCWLVWCERKTLFPAGNLRSFTSKRTCSFAVCSSACSAVCLSVLRCDLRVTDWQAQTNRAWARVQYCNGCGHSPRDQKSSQGKPAQKGQRCICFEKGWPVMIDGPASMKNNYICETETSTVEGPPFNSVDVCACNWTLRCWGYFVSPTSKRHGCSQTIKFNKSLE